MKKILFVASKYSSIDDSPYLTNDLAQQLTKQGCDVTVVAYSDENTSRRKYDISENLIKISFKIKILKYLLVWPRLFWVISRIFWRHHGFDQIIMFAPLSVMWPAAFLLKYFKSDKKTAIIFDIFPIHQIKIGALPSAINGLLKFLEKRLLANFSEITAMGERNKAYIENYYSTVDLVCAVKVVNLWGRGAFDAKSSRVESVSDVVRVVFGGQIIKGRQVESLIDFFDKLRARGLLLTLDIYSKGAGFDDLKRSYSSYSWIDFKDQLPRDQYFAELSRYHVGAIVTDQNSDLPTFPSKIIDYVEAGLKVYCLVEMESELHSVVGGYPSVYLNPFCFSDAEVEQSLDFFMGAINTGLDSGGSDLRNIFSVRTAASRLLG